MSGFAGKSTGELCTQAIDHCEEIYQRLGIAKPAAEMPAIIELKLFRDAAEVLDKSDWQ